MSGDPQPQEEEPLECLSYSGGEGDNLGPPAAGERKKRDGTESSSHSGGRSVRAEGGILGVYGRAITRPVYSMTLGLDPSCITLELVLQPP